MIINVYLTSEKEVNQVNEKENYFLNQILLAMKKVFLFVAMIFAANLSRAQWDPDVRLTNDPAYSWTSINNQWNIAAIGDTVHIIWYDNRDGNNEIYYKRSADGGQTWGTDTRLTNNSADSYHPCIALSGSTIHVVWSDKRDGNYEIYYKHSADRGSTWAAEMRLTIGDSSSLDPSIAVSGLIVSIVWYDIRDGNWEIYYKRSTDGGVTWEADKRLTNDPASSQNASVAVSDSMVHVVWGDFRASANGDIFYKNSADNGATWGQDIQLTENNAVSRRPSIAASGSLVHIVWYDHRSGDNEIFYKRSADGGITWGNDTQITNSLGASLNPSVAVSGSAVHVVWYDTRDGDLEIYYRKSDDEGLTWGTDVRLTNAPYPSENPSIAISGPVVHLAWTDNRDGNAEIYYKRDTTGGFAVGINDGSIGNRDQQIFLYPNPASDVLHFDLDNPFDEKASLTIRNLLGEIILRKQIGNSKSALDISDLQNGLYFLGIEVSGKQVVIRRLIILK